MNVDFSDLKREMEELRAKMQERGKEAFKNGAAELFETCPSLESFSWSQYTPYFNDGDPCVFGVNDYLDVEFSGDILLDGWSGSEYDRKYAAGATSEQMDTADAAHELVVAIPEETLQEIFGDHVKVTVYRDRVEVDDYDHD